MISFTISNFEKKYHFTIHHSSGYCYYEIKVRFFQSWLNSKISSAPDVDLQW